MDVMATLTLIGQNLLILGMIVYYSIVCIVKQLVPYKYRCKDIKGQTVLITGSGSGLGRSLAKKMAKLDTRVVCVDVNTKANEETVKEIKADGGNAIAFTCDLSKREEIYKVADEVRYFIYSINGIGGKLYRILKFQIFFKRSRLKLETSIFW